MSEIELEKSYSSLVDAIASTVAEGRNFLCRQLYLRVPIFQTLSGKLSWSYYCEILKAYKDQILMEYATQNISNQLFVSRYQLYLPDRKQLEQELQKLLESRESQDGGGL
ncbi:MAG: hypothetical protein IM585_13765 [Pseudanabaena sp. M135S2SP2A07QC]|uniref:hypothetical protein n=1 Tax=Microcystis sp. M074S1 TaxID=2771126 RepID=UPI00258F820D|nr:hypothetical protein [Microcystis sp. M074S1]MCA6501823.1 hypothetical protein [Pseudanabaena sp. M090S1SP2A07QC]MCA6505216.1 hypothetical protein [Pseudanabaena sp. M172S2SP2A07QC]MCA6520942.1 hypothetical protein [Pseudanabaena sp. M051S1SP2A07QC]MCA6525680.1 hypothetical protein [Pseudanabaena sp. M179S2SP2A07QC]MCA6529279.1 hypothetical protein [Pseudanabaena sp. M125S2SP2A07QC]MCA6533633.1 hypothetical protein [Pseudanabaena sp. M176S2SP2A07QC]MCA6538276.1 hypothetical protein [Pseud